MESYVAPAALKAIVAPNAAEESPLDGRLGAAVYLGSRYVDRVLGNPVAEEHATELGTLVVVPCPGTWREAALAAASFYYKLPDAPMGYLGGLADYAVRVSSDRIRTADSILVGQAAVLVY